MHVGLASKPAHAHTQCTCAGSAHCSRVYAKAAFLQLAQVRACRDYIIQDHHYLEIFGRMLSLLAAKAPRRDWNQMFATSALGVVSVESALHEQLMRRWGVALEDLDQQPMQPACVMYTSYLQAVVGTKPFFEGALGRNAAHLGLPCSPPCLPPSLPSPYPYTPNPPRRRRGAGLLLGVPARGEALEAHGISQFGVQPMDRDLRRRRV